MGIIFRNRDCLETKGKDQTSRENLTALFTFREREKKDKNYEELLFLFLLLIKQECCPAIVPSDHVSASFLHFTNC
jgi:hypothetical protein